MLLKFCNDCEDWIGNGDDQDDDEEGDRDDFDMFLLCHLFLIDFFDSEGENFFPW